MFEKDESFWEVGLHFFLILLFAMPTALLVDYLMRFEYVRNGVPVVVSALVGVPLGQWVFRRLRRRRRQPADNQAQAAETDNQPA